MLKDVDLKDDEAIKHLAWIQRGFRNLCQIKDMKITQQENKKKKSFISIAGFPKEKEVGVKVEKEIIFILKILNPSLLFMCHSLLGYLRLTITDIKQTLPHQKNPMQL